MGLGTHDADGWNFYFAVASSFFYVFLFIPFSVYHTYRYYQNRTHIIFVKRYAWITLYECILIIAGITMGTITYLSVLFNSFDLTNTLISIDHFLQILLLYFYLWRFWILKYEM